MDEKTEELRDIFMSVSDEETVTERQEETRGSLTDAGPGDDALGEVVADMRERYDFRTGLSDDGYRAAVSAFYDGDDDDAIARELDVEPATAFRVRMDLHLVTEADLSPAFDADAAVELLDGGAAPADVAAALDADVEAVERFAAALEARRASLRASNRFRDRFGELLDDAALSGRLASDAREMGLEEATEGMETDVSF